VTAPATPDLQRFSRSLGTSGLGEDLLRQALTHRSAGAGNNERLEFLGDALLGFVIAQALWDRFPAADEGQLSRMRATLVKQDSLAGLARGLSLGDYLRLGAGELRTGGHARDSILADALEALLAAVYLDQGFDAARGLILEIFGTALDGLSSGAWGKDPKTRLQELLQSRRRPLPEYQVTDIAGTQHAQVFRVRCVLTDDGTVALGDGTSRRRAEQQAAETLLRLLEGARSA
jgi:ribonuclease-3